jgi:hypothetical protein
MRKIFLLVTGILLVGVSVAQQLKPAAQKINQQKLSKENFERAQLFQVTPASKQRNEQLKSTVRNSTVMEFRAADVQALLQSQPQNLLLAIPASAEKNLELELTQVNLFTPDFSVVTSESNGRAVSNEKGLHYQGIIKGDNNSIAAISIFDGEVMGMISSEQYGTMTLGKLQNDIQRRHILYRTSDLSVPQTSGCFTPEFPGDYSPEDLQEPAERTTNCVRLYWEANYDLFQNKGSNVANVISYLTGLFNQSNILYANDGISVTLSEIFVWSTASPYTGTSTSTLLSQFQSYRNSFNGDLGHLIGLAGGGGIAASINGICNSNMDYRQCYSGISSGYNNVPTYSWSVEVVTHEQGHLLGSHHTHACVWNGNNTAIDNCGPTAGYAYEGSCSGAPTPVGGGTIMSYCHLVSGVGINFNNGFGTQPKNVILNRINNGTCLTLCTAPSCNAPAGMSTTAITTSSATFNWTAVSGAASYNVRYRVVSNLTWTNSSTASASFNAAGLSSATNYEWQVQTVCSSGSSAFTASTNFTTASVPVPCNAPTGMSTTSVTTSSATFNWTAVSGAASYNVRYRVVSNLTWTNSSTASASFNAAGLSSATNYEWQVQTVCSSGSSSFTASTNFTTASVPVPCNAPTGMSTTSITTSSATFNWTAVSGAASYNVRYRVVSNLTWTNSSTASASFNAAGLSSATNYEWQVQTVCSGGSSAFTASTLFTTLTSVCTDVYEPNNSKNSAAIIPVATNISALINPTGEYDWFTFSNTSAQRNIRITLTNLPANYDVRLYGTNGNYVAISQNSGLTSETINYNTNTVGTWRIRVNGFNGAFNASQCYTLRAEISGTPFSAPQEMISGENVSQQQSQLTLFPNPAHNNLTVNFYSETDGKAVFNLYALPGEKVMSLENNVQEGMNSFELNTSSLTNGIYIFELLSEGNAIRQKLIVSK